MEETEIRAALSRYRFYHIIPLTDAISTPGNPVYVPAQQLTLKHLRSLDLKGKRVLDIGCRDGLFSFEAEKLGAAEVVGIDNDLSAGATEFLIPYFGSRVRMEQLNLYDLAPEKFGTFDVVIFPGVLYHLRYPFWGLKAIRDVMKPGGHLVVETGIYDGQEKNAILFCPTGSESPYEASSPAIFNVKGLRDTLASLGFSTLEVEFCRGGRHPELGRMAQRMKTLARTVLGFGELPPLRPEVFRCVFVARFDGIDRSSFLSRYWEGTHDFHTEHGG